MIDTELTFPDEMIAEKRWLVRIDGKTPISIYTRKPEGFDHEAYRHKLAAYEAKYGRPPGPNHWRFSWGDSAIWATYEEALLYARSHNDVQGLNFSLHPNGDDSVSLRIICFDVDNAFDSGADVYPEVVDFLNGFDEKPFVEYSRSGKGLHVFVLCKTVPFTNRTGLHAYKLNEYGAKVDILCSQQIAVTGRPFDWGDCR